MDVAETADSLLRYLGNNAITDTRYFWEEGRNHLAEHASILISPRMLYPLVYGLFISLHRYPSKPIVKRYETTFLSLEESLRRTRNRWIQRHGHRRQDAEAAFGLARSGPANYVGLNRGGTGPTRTETDRTPKLTGRLWCREGSHGFPSKMIPTARDGVVCER